MAYSFFAVLAAVLYVSFVVRQPGLPTSQSEAESAYSITSDMLLSQSAVDDDQSTTYFYLATDKNRGVYTLPSNTSAEVINYLAKTNICC